MAEGAPVGPDGSTTKRLDFKKQSLDDAYAAPANLLEIEVSNAETHGFGRNRYTDYEVKMRVSTHGMRRYLAYCTCVDTWLCVVKVTSVLCSESKACFVDIPSMVTFAPPTFVL